MITISYDLLYSDYYSQEAINDGIDLLYIQHFNGDAVVDSNDLILCWHLQFDSLIIIYQMLNLIYHTHG